MEAADKRRFRGAVLKWYDQHGRKLPWRESADAYRIWLSEVMLQQTTVAAVVPYFERFTARFPDVQSLAEADVDEVLRLWEGLGYYSRARNLHRASRAIVSEHAGQFPSEVEALQTLPGIGRYTAGAISSFAFDQPAAIVEANTERLYARLLALRDDVRASASHKLLWQFAEELVPDKRAGDFNQALMDIGSKLCRPVDPDCESCPLQKYCGAFRNGLQKEVPVRKPAVAITAITELAVVLMHREQFLLRRRTESERWAGMWDFVRFEISAEESSALPLVQKRGRSRSLFSPEGLELPQFAVQKTQSQIGLKPGPIVASTEFSYSVTRYKVQLIIFACSARMARVKSIDGVQWFSLDELPELPLSMTGRRIADWLKAR
jgi:A/G-specific adenine glycosylase